MEIVQDIKCFISYHQRRHLVFCSDNEPFHSTLFTLFNYNIESGVGTFLLRTLYCRAANYYVMRGFKARIQEGSNYIYSYIFIHRNQEYIEKVCQRIKIFVHSKAFVCPLYRRILGNRIIWIVSYFGFQQIISKYVFSS